MQPIILVIYGASGDLTYRKLIPALFNLYVDNMLPGEFYILGVAKTEYQDGELEKRLYEGVENFSRRKPENNEQWASFYAKISYLSGDFNDKSLFDNIDQYIQHKNQEHKAKSMVISYFAIAPSFIRTVAQNMVAVSSCSEKDCNRIVVEKPFGHDLASAIELNKMLKSMFDESQIFRIDHFLGKETVQNILALRFANAMFEPIWNRMYIDNIQITAAEKVGVENRGGYYDGSGALRDMIQNHVLQMVCMIAMEAPVSFEADEIRNKKVDVLNAIRKISIEKVSQNAVRGQYSDGWIEGREVKAYRDENDVKPDSPTETFAAVRFFIDNWRWQDVPIYIRSGKYMHEKATYITVQFKPAPPFAFPEEANDSWRSNRLVIGIQPGMDISIRFQAKKPGQDMTLIPVDMIFDYDKSNKEVDREAYETLLYDIMEGDATLFMRDDQIESAWSIIMPIIDAWKVRVPVDFPNYAPGSWGPEDSEALTARDGRSWITPAKYQ